MMVESLHPNLTVQLMHNLTGVILDARNCDTIGKRLTSMAPCLSTRSRVRMIGFVFASASYRGMPAHRSEAHAWAQSIVRALEGGVRTMSITLAPKASDESSVEQCSMPLIRAQFEDVLALADPLRKLKVRYAVSQNTDDILSSDCCLLPL